MKIDRKILAPPYLVIIPPGLYEYKTNTDIIYAINKLMYFNWDVSNIETLFVLDVELESPVIFFQNPTTPNNRIK